MMLYLQMFYEFFKVGLFSIGGGLATIPFLTDLGARTGWFTAGELANMIAISESTPGPMGVNMATYVGFHTGGIAGGVIATLGLVCPSILVILVIAGFLKKFRESRGVDAVFYGIRPASTALIAAALAEVCAIALLISFAFGPEGWVNGTLASIGIDPVDWLGGPAAFGVLIVEYLWKNLGYATVLWLAALATIPERLEGAARLDGASRWQRLTRITLPLLAPTVPVLVLLSVVNAFKIYREAYLVAGSYPPQSIYLLPHLLNNWFADLSLGKLAAASMLLLAAFALLAFLLVAAWRRNARPL